MFLLLQQDPEQLMMKTMDALLAKSANLRGSAQKLVECGDDRRGNLNPV